MPRLIDWFGNYNNFYVPGAGFGQPIIIRSPSPAVQQFLQSLGASDGSWDAELELEVIQRQVSLALPGRPARA